MVLLAGLLWVTVMAPSPAEVEQAVRRVRASGRYQTELPGERAAAPSETPPRPHTTRPQRDPDPQGGSDLRPVGDVLLWLLFGALGAAAAVWLVRELQTRRRARAATVPLAAAPRETVAAALAPLPEHELLARRGEYTEAIHAILMLVLSALGRARSGMKPAWTSREILSLVKLEEGAQGALTSLVRLVEVTRFGGAPAREEEYARAVGWLDTIGRGSPA